MDLTNCKTNEYLRENAEGKLQDGIRVLFIWRIITNALVESNATLDAFFTCYRLNPAEHEYNLIYMNGDNNLKNLKANADT